MPGELTELSFLLEDETGGRRLTPETVDLPTLRGFLEEVEKLIKGDVPGASLTDSRVRIEDGSVKVVTAVAHLLALDLRADVSRLEATGDLDTIQPHRAEVIEQWQSRVRRYPHRAYSLPTPVPGHFLRVTPGSLLQRGGENSWVSVEKYLSGKVVNAGGKKDPNVHLVLTGSGESVRATATEDQLAAEKENLLYREVTLRVQAEQHLRTGSLRNIRLLRILPLENDADEQALTALWEKGREAWRDVPAAAGWVETLRGH